MIVQVEEGNLRRFMKKHGKLGVFQSRTRFNLGLQTEAGPCFFFVQKAQVSLTFFTLFRTRFSLKLLPAHFIFCLFFVLAVVLFLSQTLEIGIRIGGCLLLFCELA